LAVITAAAHALLIEGTMGDWTKAALCFSVILATAKVLADLKVWRSFRSSKN